MSEPLDLLHLRAAILAKPVQTAAKTDIGNEHLVFVLAAETFAIEASFVKEVFFLKDLTPLPGAPSFILGIVNLRGAVIPLLNFKVILGVHEYGLSEMNKVIVVHGMGMEFGIVADAILGTAYISESITGHPPVWKGANASNFVSGITPDGAIVLDATKMIQHIAALKPGIH